MKQSTAEKAGAIDDRPVIQHVDGELPRVLDEIESALPSLGNQGVFVYADRLHRIYVLPEAECGAIRRPVGAVRLHPVDAAYLAELSTATAHHKRWDRRRDDWRIIDCPRRSAEALLSRGHWPRLPTLTGVIEAPIVTPQNLVIDSAGYDRRTGLFLTGRPSGYVSPPQRPEFHDAQAAGRVLEEALNTFPFVEKTDLASAIAAILTALVRRVLPAAPLISITAPTPGTGKSLLAYVVSMIALGRLPAMLTLGHDDGETEKRLHAALLAGDAILVADNLERPLAGELLCQLMTQPSVQFRPLRLSAMVTAPTNFTTIATGNNLAVHGDMLRRTMVVRLDARTERPETRAFSRDAMVFVRERRGKLISAALTIIRGYLACDTPAVGLRPFGGFDLWDRMVRHAVVWAGFDDPLKAAQSLRDTDPDSEATAALFTAWRAVFDDAGATASDAIAEARKHISRFDGDADDPAHPLLRNAVQAAAGDKLDSKRLAGWLRRHKNRICEGLVLVADEDRHRKVSVWVVRPAK